VLSSLTVQELTAYDLPYKARRDIGRVIHNIEKDHSEQAILIIPLTDISLCNT
jgi:hypothetical protein